MKCVDTTFLIDLLKHDAQATAKAVSLDREPVVFATELSFYEIIAGIRASDKLKHALDDLETLVKRMVVLQLDHKAAIKAGLISGELLQRGEMIDDIDCLIAGISLTNGCDTIVTRNSRHFTRIKGLKVDVY